MEGHVMRDLGERAGARLAVAIFATLALCSCGKSTEQKANAEQASVTGAAEPSTADRIRADVSLDREFDEDRARDAAQDSLAGETYVSVVGTADCSTDDCEGHEAGWRWAVEGNDCGGGSSQSFDDGCAAFATAIDDRVETARAAFEKGDDAFEKQ